MKVLVYTVLLSIMVLVGCNDGTTPGSYQSIIMVNGTEYVLTQPENENVQYDRDKGIGKIERKVPIEQIPDTHLSSNELPKVLKYIQLFKTVNILLQSGQIWTKNCCIPCKKI